MRWSKFARRGPDLSPASTNTFYSVTGCSAGKGSKDRQPVHLLDTAIPVL
jgi:hypothetical protein